MKFDKSKFYTSLNAEELEVGSEVILANYLESLKDQVEANSWPSYVLRLDGVMGTSSINRFKSGDGQFNLAYLVRKVGEEKPEEEKWIAYLAMPNGNGCYLTACSEDVWNEAKQIFGAKTKLFVGTKSEVEAWYKARKKFTKVIKAWEEGKAIQVYETLFKKWVDCAGTLEWYTDCEYRVKPDCPCADVFDSKACAGCPQNEVWYVYKCGNELFSVWNKLYYDKALFSGSFEECEEWIKQHKELEEKLRPFKDCDELVEFWSKNYQTGFWPAFTKPLIWVRLKVDRRERLIVAYGDNFVEIGNKTKAVTLQHLFEQYEFLDGSPVGMEEKE